MAIFVAGAAAGTVNAVVGSGSLITFPTLLAFGFPPVVANVSNNVGLVPGNFSGAFGYRRELAGQRPRLLWLGIFSVLGAVAGAAALLALPAGAFKLVVPVLILASCVLVLLQPRLSARVAARRKRAREQAGEQAGDQGGAASHRGADQASRGGPVLAGGVFGAAIYGGYFGAAQGVLVIGLLGTFLDETMQRINGAKNVLVGMVNGTAAIVYIIFAHVNWRVVLLIAVGSTIGGLLGARIGRKLPPLALRIFIVVIGVIAVVRLIFF
ncbi:MAG: sulfite exporter TauE/SafE family protein [Streptosporangiaceae bacterium]